MIIELNLANLIFIIIAIIGAYWALAKMFLSQFQRSLNERFEAQDLARKEKHAQLNVRLDGIEATSREEASQWQRIERELLSLKAEMPREYLRRDDYAREVKALHDAVQRDILPMRQSLTRIEDFLLHNKGTM
ncbi:hypothetical protein [Rhodoferax aquaticus]|uniref:Uncharacterized protein n=1 Tax=Rhodoferax aquaticus TaxID=2527691 RepID=A0A515ERU3_9BURK|nr:hypothetical protein [Rhodoferax aquaticus]QDL55333.1 hypothetical protein EXZ61_14780 [Rhodoferax aquaticus]